MLSSKYQSTLKPLTLVLISLVVLVVSVLIFRGDFFSLKQDNLQQSASARKKKLYWFVPDGFRADKDAFNIYEWAESGEMPNLKKLLDNGCAGYSWPVFPGHTPTNFATLMTGVDSSVHGVVDGPMRTLGYPLNVSMRGGFSSFAKLVTPAWVGLEKSGYLVSLQSVPGSTPPELFKGNTIMGRWGAWGVEFPSLIVQDNTDENFQVELGANKRLFSIGSNLVRIEAPKNLSQWSGKSAEGSEYEIDLTNWGTPFWAAVSENEKKLKLSFDRKQIVAEVAEGQWSEWIPITLKYELKNDYQKNTTKKSQLERDISSIEIETNVKVKPIYLSDSKKFRIRMIYDGLNDYMSSPMQIANKMKQHVGPMVDYVDSFPPQLIHFLQDRDTFLEEADMSWQWHKKAVPFLIDNLKSDVVIHSIYSPNQMLTSRWWLPFVDPQSKRYSEISEEERLLRWKEVKHMYRQADDVLGEIMKATENKKDEDWYIILSSDHGVLPLYREVRLNNLFAQKGWLKYKYNKTEKEFEIDWKNTQVVFLQMNNIYINPEGLGGVYNRSTTAEYYQLRDQVRSLLKELKDPESGTQPLFEVWNHEDGAKAGLYADRVGDLVIANTGQYSWTEDVSEGNEVFVKTKKGGYKQAVWPKSQEGMLTPFVVSGAGINKKCRISYDINHVDQLATIQKIMNFSTDHKIQGKPIDEIFQ